MRDRRSSCVRSITSSCCEPWLRSMIGGAGSPGANIDGHVIGSGFSARSRRRASAAPKRAIPNPAKTNATTRRMVSAVDAPRRGGIAATASSLAACAAANATRGVVALGRQLAELHLGGLQIEQALLDIGDLRGRCARDRRIGRGGEAFQPGELRFGRDPQFGRILRTLDPAPLVDRGVGIERAVARVHLGGPCDAGARSSAARVRAASYPRRPTATRRLPRTGRPRPRGPGCVASMQRCRRPRPATRTTGPSTLPSRKHARLLPILRSHQRVRMTSSRECVAGVIRKPAKSGAGRDQGATAMQPSRSGYRRTSGSVRSSRRTWPFQ